MLQQSLMAFCYDLYGRFLNRAKTLESTRAQRKLCEYKKELEKKQVAAYEGFGVIAHGNFCTYNILFKYDESCRIHEAKMH